LIKDRIVDIQNFIGGILGAIPGYYNYVAEQETSGVCLQWVRDHLAMDEIGVYLQAQHIGDVDERYQSLYDYLNEIVLQTPPGANNVIFTPWMHGNRSPREDPYVRAMFFNIGLENGKRDLIRAVLEGVAFLVRWMLEAIEKKIPHRDSLRFVGGGAKSDVWCQIMADVTGRKIETIKNPQNAGTIGAAIVCAVGLGIYKTFEETKKLIPIRNVYEPRPEYKKLYDNLFKVFTQLYQNNKQAYKQLNSLDLSKPAKK
jgi:xylulokinase